MDDKLSRRDLLKYGGSLLTAAAMSGVAGSLLSPRPAFGREPGKSLPNIVFIMTDDMGYGDLGCYGGKSIRTPNIDRLAAGGMRFTDFYVCSPVCTPSRFGLLTGRYPARVDLNLAFIPPDTPTKTKLEFGFYEKLGAIGMLDTGDPGTCKGIPADEYTLAEGLKDAGYSTCIIGKWHLGYTPEYSPNVNGFDYFYGSPGVNDIKPFKLMRNDTVLEEHITDQTTLTKRYTVEALDFIERSKNGPFFLYFAHTFPHHPYHASDDFLGKSKGGLYGDTVEEIDWSVGEVMKKLDELGLSENTIVIFTNDNGQLFEGSPAGMRGCKGLTYEGGFRVPMIARWPNMIRPGTVNRGVAVNLDFYPTFFSIAGVPLPDDRPIDGRNMMHMFKGDEKSPNEAIYYYHAEKLEAIRVGRWKYMRKHNVYVWPSNLQQKGPWLFDMEVDPNERYNMGHTYPDVMKELEAKIVEWENSFEPKKW